MIRMVWVLFIFMLAGCATTGDVKSDAAAPAPAGSEQVPAGKESGAVPSSPEAPAMAQPGPAEVSPLPAGETFAEQPLGEPEPPHPAPAPVAPMMSEAKAAPAPVPSPEPKPAPMAPASPASASDSAMDLAKFQSIWAGVLKKYVNTLGQIDFRNLAKNPTDLKTAVDFIGRVSPQNHPDMFPTREARLAFDINTFNILAMYGIVQKNLPTDFNNFFARTGFFSQTEFMIGGRLMSLNDFEDEVIRPLGDARVHFALNRMTLGGPRLPREPFTAGDLNQQLESAAREFINDSVQVQVIDPARVARLSPLFHWYAEDFMKFAKARTYLEYVNRYRVKKIDDSFDVDFSDFDWMVNAR